MSISQGKYNLSAGDRTDGAPFLSQSVERRRLDCLFNYSSELLEGEPDW